MTKSLLNYFDFTTYRVGSALDLTFVLRSMLFSYPVHIIAFNSIGVSVSKLIVLEGIFLIGASITQLIGGLIKDALSPRFAYGLGKLITGISCALIAFQNNYQEIQLLNKSIKVFETQNVLEGRLKQLTYGIVNSL